MRATRSATEQASVITVVLSRFNIDKMSSLTFPVLQTSDPVRVPSRIKNLSFSNLHRIAPNALAKALLATTLPSGRKAH